MSDTSPQYRTCAELTYTLLVDGQLEWVRLLSDDAGQIDDFVIATPGRIDAYQIKYREDAAGYTLKALMRATRTRSGRAAYALLRQLAVGWTTLHESRPDRDVHVHLVLRGIPTTIGSVSGIPPALREKSFSQFLTEWWSTPTDPTADSPWLDLAEKVQELTGFDSETFHVFRTHASLEFRPQVEPFRVSDDPVKRGQEADIERLAHHLLEKASAARQPLTLTRDQILNALGWQKRFSLFYPQEFRTDPRYQPIEETVAALRQAIERFDTGYLALVGSPGSGKSTTLTRTLREQAGIRFVRYYAFIPDDAVLNRGEAHSFLHDVVIQLRQQGIFGNRRFAPDSLADLQNELSAQLATLGRDWQENRKRTVILVDGLDHIEREQTPDRSLISALPLPASLPSGVIIVLGTQTTQLSAAPPSVLAQLRGPDRTIEMRRLSRGAISTYLAASHLPVTLCPNQTDAVSRVSEGHPLALALLTQQLTAAYTPAAVDAILAEAPHFQDSIERTYETHWTRLVADTPVVSLLGYIARMRGTVDLRQLVALVGEAPIERLRNVGKPYLRFLSATRCQIFHNSFRQFLLRQTGRNIFGETNADKHRSFHRRLAETAEGLPSSDPFGWEAVYHAHCAGDFNAVTRIGSAEFFRNQARHVRYVRAIYGDLRLVFGAARELGSPMAAISAALISREISRRFRWQEDMNLPELLLSLYGPEAAVQQMVWNGSIVAASEDALAFSATLYDAGFGKHAEELFELAQPLAVIEAHQAVELGFVHNDESELTAWASVASRFRPVSGVIAAVRRAKIHAAERFSDLPSERAAQRHRYRALENIFTSLVARNAWGQLESAFGCIRSEKFFPALQASVDRQICEKYPNDERAVGSFERLEASTLAENKSAPSPLELANFAWLVTNDQKRVDTWLQQAEMPQTPTSPEHGLAKYADRLIHSRLRAIVGRPVDVSTSIPVNEGQRSYTAALMDRVVADIGTLWGSGLAGRTVDVGAVRALTGKLLLFFDQEQSSAEYNFEWHSVQREAPEVFGWLIRAAATHGRDKLEVLAEEFDQRWASSPRWPWSFDNQREVAVKLFAADQDREGLIRRLDRIEITDGVEDEQSSRIAYQRDQALAWLRVGEISKAESCFKRMLETANGIREGGEDDEAKYWVEWFVRQAEPHNPSTQGDVELLANALTSLAKRRAHVGESMTKLALAAGKFFPAWNYHLWASWLDRGAASWIEAVTGISLSLIANGHAALAVVAIRRLLVPWEANPDKTLVERASAALAESKNEESHKSVEQLIDTLSTKAFSSVRNVWSKALGHAYHSIGKLASNLPQLDAEPSQDSERVKNPARETKLTLPEGQEVPIGAAIETVDSAATAVALLNANRSVYHISAKQFVELVSERVKPQDRKDFYELSLREVSASRILSAMSNHLHREGHSELAEQFALRALDEAEPSGWEQMYDGGLALSAAEALIQANTTKGRQITFDRWAGDLFAGNTGISEHFEPFDKLIGLLFENPPRKELWQLLREHVSEFVEYRERTEKLPPLPESDSHVSAGEIVVDLFHRGCKLGSPAVEDECVRGLVELIQFETCRDALASLLRGWLIDSDVWQNKALAILHPSATTHAGFVRGFAAEITRLTASTFLTVRRSAVHLASKLGVANVPPEERPLSPIYDLVLPEIPEPEHHLPSSVYGAGAVSPETEDQWEWVGVIQDELRILSEASGMPLQNLVRRLAILMREIAPRESWSPTAESKLRERLKDAGLLVSWPRLRSAMATRALDFALAELLDHGRVETRAALLLRSRIDAVDLVALSREPMKRPSEVRLPARSEMDPRKTETWLDGVGESLNACTSTLTDGRVVLAELTRIRRWTRDALEEVRTSCWTGPNAHPSDNADVMYGLLPTRNWWRADIYPNLPAVDTIQAMGLYFNPVFVRAGHCEWLVCHPIPCRSCGWQPRGLGMWLSDERPMVETLWWQEAPPRRADIHNEEITSEGWLAVAAPEAAATLAEKFPCVVRKRVERRVKADAFSTTGETKAAEWTGDIPNFGEH